MAVVANMYPRTLYEPDLKSKGEKRVFEALRDALDDNWDVFHSVSWIAPRRTGAPTTARSTSSSATRTGRSSASR